jgi:hypothetical protein
MANRWCLLVAAGCVLFGLLCFFAPKTLHRINQAMNRTFTAVDEQLMRSRYVMGGLLLIAAACFFYLARLLSR